MPELMLAYCLMGLGIFLVIAALVYAVSSTCSICTRKIMPWSSKLGSYHEVCDPERNKLHRDTNIRKAYAK